MKSKSYKKDNFFKIIYTLLFGLSTILSFGQPDPPPNEVPLDSNSYIFLSVAILFSAFVFIRNYNSRTIK